MVQAGGTGRQRRLDCPEKPLQGDVEATLPLPPRAPCATHFSYLAFASCHTANKPRRVIFQAHYTVIPCGFPEFVVVCFYSFIYQFIQQILILTHSQVVGGHLCDPSPEKFICTCEKLMSSLMRPSSLRCHIDRKMVLLQPGQASSLTCK